MEELQGRHAVCASFGSCHMVIRVKGKKKKKSGKLNIETQPEACRQAESRLFFAPCFRFQVVQSYFHVLGVTVSLLQPLSDMLLLNVECCK